MHLSKEILALIGFAVLFLGIGGLVAYICVCIRIASKGGKVPVDKFDFVDFVACLVMVTCLVSLTVDGYYGKPGKIHDSALVSNALVYYLFLTALCAFIHYRGINLATQFGLRSLRVEKVLGWGIVLFLAAYPLTLLAGVITQHFLKDSEPQELVNFFKDAVQQGRVRSILLTLFTGVIMAPVVEETVFRGYIYPVMKRHLGMIAGIVLSAALFSAMHLNAASFPALCLLAVCLTLAYEFTGSLLVNITMHSLFNLSTFLFLYLRYHNT